MPRTCVYKTIGDCAIKLDVYPGQGPAPRPALVWIHGGALIMSGRRSMPTMFRELCTAAGFTQFSIDYRLAPETKLPSIIDDVIDAVDWIRRNGPGQFGIDAARIAVAGRSAGGYLTLMSGFRVQPRPRALVSLCGYGEIVDWYSQPDAYYCTKPTVGQEEAYTAVGGPPLSEVPEQNRRDRFYLYCRQQGRWLQEVAAMDPHRDGQAFAPYCPERNVDSDYPPTLLIHGSADTDVPYHCSVTMAAALKRGGIAHEFLTIPDADHGFDFAVTRDEINASAPPPAASALLRAVEFLRQHLSDESEQR